MSWGLSISCWIYFQPPLLSVNVERFAILYIDVFTTFIVQFVSMVYIIWINFISELRKNYKVLIVFLLNWKNVPSLY